MSNDQTAITSYLENPQHSLVDALGSLIKDNATGVNVDHDAIMGVPACRRATSIVSGLVARLPVSIVKHIDSLDKIDENHINQAVLRRPHKYYGWYTLCRTLTGVAMWFGNAYAIVLRDGITNGIESFAILDTEKTFPILVNGELRYKTEIDGDKVILGPDEVLHIKNIGSTGLFGWSVIDQLKDNLGLSIAMIKFSGNFFRNNANVGMVIQIPNYIKDQEEITAFRKGLDDFHVGVGKSHRTMLLQGGASLNLLTVDASAAQLIEARQHDILDISNITGVPPHMLGSARNTSFNSLESEIQSFIDTCIADWMATWAEALELVCLTEFQKRVGSHSVKHSLDNLLKADIETQHSIDIADLNNGLKSFNEIRLSKGLDPVAEDWADWHRIPENTTYSELVAAEAEAAEAAPAPEPQAADNTPIIGEQPATPESPDDLTDEQEIPDDRFARLKAATMKRLHERLTKAYRHAVEQRQDMHVSPHAKVFVESGLDFTEATAQAYIQDWIKGQA